MRKIFFIFLAGIIGFYGLSFAFNEFSYENAKSLANEYIANSSFDENWKDTHPHIEGEGKYFYTDADTPSYVEFKVACDKTKDCGFVMVNFDGDDVSIPIASTSGNTPSEVLAAKNGNDGSDNKLYYFNPFEQYAENELTGDVASIDPQDDFGDEVSGTGKLTPEIKKEKKAKKNKSLKDKIVKAKSEAKEFKKSDDFKKKRKELKDKKQTNGKEEVSFKYLDIALAGYTSPPASNKFVYGNSSYSTCNGQTPCYKQFTTSYSGITCQSGCVPTAMGIVYGYYDRLGVAPNLLTGTASTFIDQTSTGMIKTLGDYMGTICATSYDGTMGGSTKPINIEKGLKYAKDKGYLGSTGSVLSSDTLTLFYNIRNEIDVSRPVIVNSSNHSMVAYGYNNTTSVTKIIRVNLGWGELSSITGDNGVKYYASNIDYNMDSLYYSGGNQYGIKNIFTFTLKK